MGQIAGPISVCLLKIFYDVGKCSKFTFIFRYKLVQSLGTSMLIAAVFTRAKTWKQSKCPPIVGWIRKMGYIHTMEYFSVIKNNEIMPFTATWMDLEVVILSEDKYRVILPI